MPPTAKAKGGKVAKKGTALPAHVLAKLGPPVARTIGKENAAPKNVPAKGKPAVKAKDAEPLKATKTPVKATKTPAKKEATAKRTSLASAKGASIKKGTAKKVLSALKRVSVGSSKASIKGSAKKGTPKKCIAKKGTAKKGTAKSLAKAVKAGTICVAQKKVKKSGRKSSAKKVKSPYGSVAQALRAARMRALQRAGLAKPVQVENALSQGGWALMSESALKPVVIEPKASVTIGRHRSATVRLDDRKISVYHAELRMLFLTNAQRAAKTPGLYLRSLSDSNPCRVRGVKVRSWTSLQAGDTVELVPGIRYTVTPPNSKNTVRRTDLLVNKPRTPKYTRVPVIDPTHEVGQEWESDPGVCTFCFDDGHTADCCPFAQQTVKERRIETAMAWKGYPMNGDFGGSRDEGETSWL